MHRADERGEMSPAHRRRLWSAVRLAPGGQADGMEPGRVLRMWGQEPGPDVGGGHTVGRFGETGPVCGGHSSAYDRTYPITTVDARPGGPLPRESRATRRPLEADLPEAVANAGVAPMREWISDTQAG